MRPLLPPDKSSLTEQAEAQTKQANTRTDEANTRTKQAEALTDRANTRTDEANTRTAQADLRTEKAETETELLRASELSYRRLFESARDGILILNAETGHITDVNPFLVELLGFSHSHMLGKTVGELSPFKDILSNQVMLERLQKDGYIRYEDLPLETRDGRQISVEFVSNVYQAGDKKVIQCNIRDVSERKRAEVAMNASEARYRRLFEAAKDGILILNAATGRIVDANPFLAELLGCSRESFVGKQLWELGFFKDIAANEAHFAELQARDYIRYDDLPLETSDGRRIDVEFVSNTYNVDGHRVMQCNIRDITQRKTAEMGMSRLAAIVESSEDAIFSQDLAGIVTSWNHGAEKIFGYHAAEMVGTSVSRLVPPGCQDDEDQTLGKIQRGEYAGHRETLRQTRDELTVDVSVTMSPIKDATGKVIGVSKILRDIRARKGQAREIERLSRLYAALSHINQAIVSLNTREELFANICRGLVEVGKLRMAWVGWLDQTTRRVSPVAQYGDSRNYLSQVTIYADDRPEGQGPTGTAIREARNYFSNDFSHDPRTAPWRQAAELSGFQSSASLLIRQGGLICGAITVYAGETNVFQDKEIALLQEAATDISFALDNIVHEAARRQAEESLRLLNSAVLQSKDSIVITDAELNLPGPRIIFVNPAFTAMTGYSAEEAIGKTPRILQGANTDRALLRQLRQNLERGEDFAGEAINYRKDGREFNLQWQIAPLRNTNGVITHFVAIQRDTTEHKKLETQLRQSQKMEAIGTLAGGVAHDFNNILAIIQMQADLLQLEGGLSAAQSELANDINSAVKRAADLTRQLLLFSRKEVLQLSDLDLNQNVTEMMKMLTRILGENIAVQAKLAAQPMFLHADAGMMDQVLMNLAVNARDAMPAGGQLIIETAGVEFDEFAAAQTAQARPGSFVRLSVSDNGCGIPPENLPHIFEPFFTTKNIGKGTGLGLATVFGIAQQHQGWINVYSEIGHGTTFKVYLPRLAESRETKILNQITATNQTGDETILLVEDEPALRAMMGKALTRLGYHLLDAATGFQALEVWNEHPTEIHLLLTDLMMPDGMTGRELAQRLLRDNPQLKVIYMSGYSAEIVAKDFPLQDGVNFLPKPFLMQKLAQTIRACLEAAVLE